MLGDTETGRDIFVDESLRQHSKYVGFAGGDLFRQFSFNLQRLVSEEGGAPGDVAAVAVAQEEITFAGARTSKLASSTSMVDGGGGEPA